MDDVKNAIEIARLQENQKSLDEKLTILSNSIVELKKSIDTLNEKSNVAKGAMAILIGIGGIAGGILTSIANKFLVH